jgi:hypothetical protein
VALRIFGISIVVTIASLIAGFLYGGWQAALLVAILGVFEVSLSFDNAVVNATILQRMSEFWQKIFLTIGVLIAVFGMRLVFPLLIVGITANLSPIEAIDLAMQKRPAEDPGSYEAILTEAHPMIAAFGGMFLLMLFLDFIFTDREIVWLAWLERPLAKIGKLDQLSIVIAAGTLVIVAETLAEEPEVVLTSGVLGMITYIAVNGLGTYFEKAGEEKLEDFADDADDTADASNASGGPSNAAKATGKAGFFLFLYLEVLDASFSFDGVIGAFAITSDPIIIALGLGLIGAMFVRSITVYLVRKGTLAEYRYLEHGAHWAIGALAAILMISIGHHVNEVVTGLVGVAIILAAYVTSVLANKRDERIGKELETVGASV